MNDNEIELDSQIRRKAIAEEITNNPVYIEAITAMKGELYASFSKTGWKDSAERDEIWRKQQAIEWFESYLRRVMETGKLAEHTLFERFKRKLGKKAKQP